MNESDSLSLSLNGVINAVCGACLPSVLSQSVCPEICHHPPLFAFGLKAEQFAAASSTCSELNTTLRMFAQHLFICVCAMRRKRNVQRPGEGPKKTSTWLKVRAATQSNTFK